MDGRPYSRSVLVKNLRAGDSLICMGKPHKVIRTEFFQNEPGSNRPIWRVFIDPPVRTKHHEFDMYALYGLSRVVVTRSR